MPIPTLRGLQYSLLLLALCSAPTPRAGAAEPAGAPPSAFTGAPAPESFARRVDERIRTFADQDRRGLARGKHIVFVGSSIFEQWADLAAQMAPLPVLNRAIGGTVLPQQLANIDALVLQYRPDVVVLYCGSNDVNAGDSAATIAANARKYIELVHDRLPRARIVYASIIRAPQKRRSWNVVDEANARIRGYIRVNADHVSYVDLNPAVFDERGEPRLELYREDLLHYKPPAYEGFTRLVKPVLQELWSPIVPAAAESRR